jgi:hypothetical protein
MTSTKTTTFDEAAYRDDLVRAGLEPDDAAALAAKTAAIRRVAVESATMKHNLIAGGMPPEKAKRMADAHAIFNPTGPIVRLKDSAPPPPRVQGFQSMGDIFGPFQKQEQPSSKAHPAPPEAAEPEDVQAAPAAAEKPATARKTSRRTTKSDEPSSSSIAPMPAVFDYRSGELPERVRELIEAHLAIEAQDAKSAGTLGFMTRSLAIATLPHRKSNDFRFVRRNGDFTLTMMTAHPQGLPYGTLPRLLLTWVCTEVAQKRERVLSLGNNLASYLAELGLHNTGGKRGDITRLKHAMTTLFSSVISCHYDGKDSFALQNVLLADKVDWWTPQNPEEAGQWQSSLMLSEPFFKECIEHVLPFDMRAVRGLRQSPLALDIYVWLTYRMSYLSKRTTIPWVALAGQFGSGYAMTEQGLRDFKRAFLRELKHVLVIYPKAKVADGVNGLVMYPSPPHVAYKSTPIQKGLAF